MVINYQEPEQPQCPRCDRSDKVHEVLAPPRYYCIRCQISFCETKNNEEGQKNE